MFRPSDISARRALQARRGCAAARRLDAPPRLVGDGPVHLLPLPRQVPTALS